MNEEAILLLYNDLKDTYDIGSIDDFKNYLMDDNKKQMFFEQVIKPKYDVNTIEDFESVYGLSQKKKEDSTVAATDAKLVLDTEQDFLDTQTTPVDKKEEEYQPQDILEPIDSENAEFEASLKTSVTPENIGTITTPYRDINKILEKIGVNKEGSGNDTEEYIVPEMQYKFGKYGFDFEKANPLGDAMRVKARGTNKELYVKLDRLWGQKGTAKELEKFLRDNKRSEDEILKQSQAIVKNKRIVQTEEELKSAIKLLNQQSERFVYEDKEYGKAKAELDSIYESNFSNISKEQLKNNPVLREDYKAWLESSQNLEINRKQLENQYTDFKYRGAKLDNIAGKYTAMKAKQGTWWSGFWNEIPGNAGATFTPINSLVDLSTYLNEKIIMSGAFGDVYKPRREKYKKDIIKIAKEKGLAPKELNEDMTLDQVVESLGGNTNDILSFFRMLYLDPQIEKLGIEDKLKKEETNFDIVQGTLLDIERKNLKYYEPRIDPSDPEGKRLISARDRAFSDALSDDPKFRNPFSVAGAKEDNFGNEGMVAAGRKAFNFLKDKSTTEQWAEVQKQGNFMKKGFLGLGGSLPAMFGTSSPIGWAQRTAQMYNMATDHVDQEMEKNPMFDKISETEKTKVKMPIGIATAVLENIGLRNIISQKGLLNSLVYKALGKSNKNTTAKTFQEFIRQDIESMIGRGSLVVVGAGLAEFETGFAQEMASIKVKDVYNASKEAEMFDTPKTFAAYMSQVVEAGMAEAVGGFIMGSIPATTTAISGLDVQNLDPKTFEIFEKTIQDPTLKSTYIAGLKNRIANPKDLTDHKAAQKELDLVNKLEGIMLANRVPFDSFNTNQRKEALQLLLQKETLENEIKTADKVLSKPKQDLLDRVNKRLNELTGESIATQEEAEAEAEGIKPFGIQEEASTEIVVEDPSKGYSFEYESEQEVPSQLESIEPISKSEIEVDGKKKIRLTFSGQQLIDAGLGKLKTETTPEVETEAEVDDEVVYEMNKTNKKTWSKDFEIIDNRNGLELGPVEENGKWAVRNKVTGEIVNANTKKDAQNIIANAPAYAEMFGDGTKVGSDMIVTPAPAPKVEVKVEPEAAPEVKAEEEIDQDEQTDIEEFFKDEIDENVQPVSPNLSINKKGKQPSKQNKNKAKIIKIAKASARSIAKLLPKTKIVLHESQEEFLKYAPKGRGYYDTTTDTIHVNLSIAQLSTVPHEVFHAVLLNKLKTDPRARAMAIKMVESVKKTLPKSSELYKEIDAFSKLYTGDQKQFQEEEFIAQLIGLMSSQEFKSYKQLKAPAKYAIVEFFKKIAKKFGIKLGQDFGKDDQSVIDFINVLATKTVTGEEITEQDVEILDDGTTPIGSPTEINSPRIGRQSKIDFKDSYDMSLVTPKNKINLSSLIENIISNDQKVWFWVADQLGLGDGMDAGPSFALQPENIKKKAIWASGLDNKKLERNISAADFIFIISGSPETSKLFNKKVFDKYTDILGDYNSFKEKALETNPVKAIRETLQEFDSWAAMRKSPKRKAFLIAVNVQSTKPNTKFHKLVNTLGGFVDLQSLRDGFYRENNFVQNDIMLVLKPTGIGKKSNHSTYSTDILGEVVGVPDIKLNAEEIMPQEIKDKIKGKNVAEKTSSIAPYGGAVSTSVKEITQPSGREQQDAPQSRKQRTEKDKKEYKNSAFFFGGFFTGVQRQGFGKSIISNVFKTNPKLENILLYTQEDAIGFWKKIGGTVVEKGLDKNGIIRYFVQIERSNVAGNGDIKTLGISYKNLETKKSKIAKGEYAIKMGKSKIGFFFVRDVGTIKTNPMGVIIDSKKTRLSDTPQSRKQQDAPKSRQQLPSNWAEVKSLEELNLNEKEKKSYKKNISRVEGLQGLSIKNGKLIRTTEERESTYGFKETKGRTKRNTYHFSGKVLDEYIAKDSEIIISTPYEDVRGYGKMMDVHPTDIFMYAIGDIEISKNSIIVTFNQDFYKKLEKAGYNVTLSDSKKSMLKDFNKVTEGKTAEISDFKNIIKTEDILFRTPDDYIGYDSSKAHYGSFLRNFELPDANVSSIKKIIGDVAKLSIQFKENNLEKLSKIVRKGLQNKSLEFSNAAYLLASGKYIYQNEIAKIDFIKNNDFVEYKKKAQKKFPTLFNIESDAPQSRQQRTTRLAPNGKQSNLTDVQYDAVRTPVFKKWFGDWETDPANASKVVDENGEPLVVYHGSTAVDIEVFLRSLSTRISSGLKEFGTYFSTNKELSRLYAEGDSKKEYKNYVKGKIKLLEEAQEKVRSNAKYNEIDSQIKKYKKVLDNKGEIYPVFLNIRKIKTFDGNGEANIEAWRNLKADAGYKIAQNRDAMEVYAGLNSMVGDKLKVDGIEAKNIIEMSPGTTDKNSQAYIDAKAKYLGDAYLLFDGQPQNIKLADGSNTTFDTNKPSVRQQKSTQELINEGRQNNFTEDNIRDFLVRVLKKPAKEVDKLMSLDKEFLEVVPKSFANIKGGIQEGIKLYKKIEAYRKKLIEKNNKEPDGRNKTIIDSEIKGVKARIKAVKNNIKFYKDELKKLKKELLKSKKKKSAKEISNLLDSNSYTADLKKAEIELSFLQNELTVLKEEKPVTKNRKLTSTQIVDKTIEYLQLQPEYINEGDKYTVGSEKKGTKKTLTRTGFSTQQARMLADYTKTAGVRPTNNMGAKIRKAKAAVRERVKGGRDLQKQKTALRNFIRQSLPPVLYTKKRVIDLVNKINDVNQGNIENLMKEVIDFVNETNVKSLQEKIKSIIDNKYFKVESGRKKPIKISDEIAKRIKFIKSNMLSSKSTLEEISEANLILLERFDALASSVNQTNEIKSEMVDITLAMQYNNSLLLENKNENKVIQLNEMLSNLEEMIEFGRSELRDQILQKHLYYLNQFEMGYESITGKKMDMSDPESFDELNKMIKTYKNEVKKRASQNVIKKFFTSLKDGVDRNIFGSAEDMFSLMDRLDKLPGEMYGGNLQEMFTDRVDGSNRLFKGRMMLVEQLIQAHLEEIYGKKWKDSSRKNRVDKDLGIMIQDGVPLSPMSQNQIGYLYNMYKDPANRKAFADPKMYGIKTIPKDATKAEKEAIEELNKQNAARVMTEIIAQLDSKVKETADWQVNELYPFLYNHYNDAYKKLYRTDLPWNEFYAGTIYREGMDEENASMLDMLNPRNMYSTAVGGAGTKMRQNSSKPIKEMDMMDVLNTYLNQMEYFAAFGEVVNDMNKFFNNKYVADAIKSIHGNSVYNFTLAMVDKIASRGSSSSMGNKLINGFNNVFILSRLALSPVIMIKQLTSFITYMNDIGPANYLKYAAKNKLEMMSVYKEIRDNSVYMKDRQRQSIMRAIETYSDSNMKQFVPSGTKDWIVNFAMWTTKFGDKAAIYIGGMPNYSYYKAQFKKENPQATEQEAIDHAIINFERDTKRTQQSGDLQDKDYTQTKDPIYRGLNMFLTTPKQYLRKEIVAIRNLNRKLMQMDSKAGKGTIAQNLRTFVMYHVVMPVFFQYVSMGLPGILRDPREDDDEDLLRAAIIGNLNALFIIGELFNVAGDLFTNKIWTGNTFKSVGVLSIAGSLSKKFLYANNLKDAGKKEEAYKKAYLELATLTGVPAPTIARYVENYGNIGKDGDIGKDILRLLNFSKYQIEGPGKPGRPSSPPTIQELNEEYDRKKRKEQRSSSGSGSVFGSSGRSNSNKVF